MRTTIDVNERLLKEAMRLRKTATKKEFFNGLLEDELRKERIQELINRWGKIRFRYNLGNFLRIRHKD